jgi:AraC-like DNA-binding protein
MNHPNNVASSSTRVRSRERQTISAFAPEALPGVRIVQSANSTQPYSYYNDVYTIVLLVHCESQISFRGKAHRGTSRTVGLLRPDGVFRHIDIPIPEVVRKLHIEPHVVEEAARELGVGGGGADFRAIFSNSQQLFNALSRLHESLLADPSPLELQSHFAVCVRLIVDERIGGAPLLRTGHEPRVVRKTRDLLHSRFAERVTLDELAKEARVSTHYLLRSFTRAVGLPPHAYQTHLRVAQARRLLEKGLSLSSVASQVGFADQSHLSRHFRRTLGFTPGAYLTRDDARRRACALAVA